ncbi:hypothetical protein F4861DRAFT_535354 [Xylaria intraflava]|nr:hypothetical protein F4861DRAFT_535354 [Xylaria intraflava]
MPGYSRFATAPRPWASVLLGNGLFLKDDKTAHRDSKDRELRSIIPDTENFLQIRPSIGCQQYWPLKTTSTGKTAGKSESVVFLVVCTGHACYDKRIVTEVGFTIFDTRERWVGGKYGAKSRARTEGCMALGDRGKNLVRLYDSHHYIVADTADHHNGTCADGRHNEKPFDFCYKKSSVILRRQLNTTLETAFSLAAKKGLDDFDIRWGKRRLVVLLSWGDELSDAISKTKWFKDTSFAEHWDVSEHQVLKRIFPRGITFANALRAFGVPHTVGGFDIAQNCGNKSSFIMQLFWAMTLATAEQIKVIKHSKDGILKPWGSPGVESVLTRDNLPPGKSYYRMLALIRWDRDSLPNPIVLPIVTESFNVDTPTPKEREKLARQEAKTGAAVDHTLSLSRPVAGQLPSCIYTQSGIDVLLL